MPVAVVAASASVTGREIIRAALSFHLNRLSPGEQEDADLFGRCLLALNFIADQCNGQKAFLSREIFTQSTAITGTYGTLGVDWAGLLSGDEILGATVEYGAGFDVPMHPLSMEQYERIALKSVASIPRDYAHDGAATVFIYPAATGQKITLRTREIMSEFADLDTGYTMPKGYKSGLAAWLAEKMAPSLLGAIPPNVKTDAYAARCRLIAQNIEPAIIGGKPSTGNIFTGFR
jgi:hypothetical protein